ncbi:cysteine desulfurase [alpha proteobacterium U9-1i]|nr:cysteine desulfurase [alpha proteobacterium U9-1i]
MASDLSRRALFAAPALAACATTMEALPLIAPPSGVSSEDLARDEAYWRRIASLYDAPQGFLQLENGYWGAMTRPVQEAFTRYTAMANQQGSHYARREYDADLLELRAHLAAILQVAPEEIAFTRNATESLFGLISGYNKLRPGDAVLYADLDYDSAIEGMEWLRQRRGVDVIKIDLPHPATRQGIIDAYDAAFAANPRVRMALVTHVSHRTGLVPPVAEIVAAARRHNVDCIVDSAHALGQLDFTPSAMGVDFAVFNLHKWIGAPIGVGALYIRRDRIGDIDPYMSTRASDRTNARVHTGTTNFGAFLAARDALALHTQIGAANKQARLRRLRGLWAERVRAHPGFEVMTPSDPTMTSAITSFRLRGRVSDEDNRQLAARLLDEFGVFTVVRIGTASGACVRVTPALFTPESDMIRFAEILESIAG